MQKRSDGGTLTPNGISTLQIFVTHNLMNIDKFKRLIVCHLIYILFYKGITPDIVRNLCLPFALMIWLGNKQNISLKIKYYVYCITFHTSYWSSALQSVIMLKIFCL